MLKKLVLSMLLLALPIYAQIPLPKPHDGGDYWIRNEDTWLDWEVICNELAGRLTPIWPMDDQDPGALLSIDWLVPQWPVIRTFGKGERLQAVPDEGGGILIKDIDGSSWMKVQTRDGRFCFVRANAKYVRPVKPVAPAPLEPLSDEQLWETTTPPEH